MILLLKNKFNTVERMIWFNRFHTFVLRLHVNRASESDHQMWKVVVGWWHFSTLRAALPHVGALFTET